jgi:hypothetical protein
MTTASYRRFKIEASKIRRKLRRMPDEITRDLQDGVKTQATALLQTMKGLAPISDEAMPLDFKGKRRKHLRDALRAHVAKGGLSARVGLLGKRANEVFFFARFLEFGTKRIPKGRYSFMLPAFRVRRDRMRKTLKALTKQAFARAARSV